MALLYCAGDYGNLYARGTVTCNPAALATAPLSALYDAKPNPFQFGSILADSYIQLRNNLLTNPGFESALGSEWTCAATGTGTAPVRITSDDHSGAACLQLNAGAAGTSTAYQAVTVRAGEYARLDFWAKPGVGRTIHAQLYWVEGGQYFNPAAGGSWQAAAVDVVTVTNTASWTRCANPTLYQMPTYATALWPTMTLRLIFTTTDNGNVLVDDAALIPGVNGASLHGHNLTLAVTPTLRYSDDAFAADDNVAATFTVRRPTFYAYLNAAMYREYWRVKLGGTPTAAPYFSTGWIGYFSAAAVAQTDGGAVSQLPIATIAGSDPTTALRYRAGRDRARKVEISFEYWTEAEWLELMRDLDQRTYGGYSPLMLVPNTLTNEAPVLFGRIDPGVFKLTRQQAVIWKAPLVVTEMAFPTMGA